MAPRIEKIWGTIFSQTAVKRKETQDREGSPTPQYDHNQQQGQQQNERDERVRTVPEPTLDRATLEKAIAEMKLAGEFAQTGIVVEIVASGPTLFVRFTQPGGAVIKMLSAEEFMRQKSSSAPEGAPRGKILDQKF